MSTSEETAHYIELQPGDKVQVWDQWLDQFGQWQFYTFPAGTKGVVSDGVKARRPIRTTHQTTLEEVPGSRTSQHAIDQPQRERIAYEELQAGDLIQEGDQWQNEDGRWHPLVLTPGSSMQVNVLRVRRPHNITALEKYRGDLIDDIQRVTGERREARAEVQTLSTALKSAQRARDELQLQVDELRAGLMGVVSAEHVHSMLEDMLDQTEWVGQCLDASTYEQMSCIQRTIAVIAERVNDMGKEDTSAND